MQPKCPIAHLAQYSRLQSPASRQSRTGTAQGALPLPHRRTAHGRTARPSSAAARGTHSRPRRRAAPSLVSCQAAPPRCPPAATCLRSCARTGASCRRAVAYRRPRRPARTRPPPTTTSAVAHSRPGGPALTRPPARPPPVWQQCSTTAPAPQL
ncbi:hypothetical protein GUJ93_ZPchr0015g6905 [Zizania palustris]|uniref:Uncharacterized protein n=1 Tax=Zizania palustris TaxID=103762 RepID=A0A8J5TD59_ZIZPA|nr:hypothetical protein GUJ93_ZPchr0015g6905 [Zizania palustris]